MTTKQIDEDELEKFLLTEIAGAPKLGYRPEPFERMLTTFRRVQAERTVVAPADEELFSRSGRSGDAEEAANDAYHALTDANKFFTFSHQRDAYENGFLDGVRWLMKRLGRTEQ